MSQLVTVHTGLASAGCAFLLHVCEDKYQLHSLIFSEGEGGWGDTRPQLGEFLDRLCLVLYFNL